MQYHDTSALLKRGLQLPDPASVWVDRAIDLGRIEPGSRLEPGVRLEGELTTLGPDCHLGVEGPVVLKNVATGRGVKVASGSVENAVLLDAASLGPAAHVRGASLLEEGASTGHAVGLKQSLLLSFATLGSNVNFCDCLITGGRSRADHSEVGSGFIHFNFTPFGARGDKATASLFGDVPRGVLMREDRVFLGGAGGVVGPVTIGFGTVLAAGSVYRRSYADHLLVYGESLPSKKVAFDPMVVKGADRRLRACRQYIAQLRALRSWYREVRLGRSTLNSSPDWEQRLLLAAIGGIEAAERERFKQADRLVANLEWALINRADAYQGELAAMSKAARDLWKRLKESKSPLGEIPASLAADLSRAPSASHLDWLGEMKQAVATEATAWMQSIVECQSAIFD
ncbi:MAG: UDP-N-acetylglucosamine pyrophosphorylase [Planctomycetota bacterium]